MSELPVIVIGAGPVGLAAALHLVDRGAPVRVFEAGPSVGAGVLGWAHVRMFSPWQFNVDPLAAGRLEAAGWRRPPAGDCPTGRELVDHYLRPLAALPALAPHIRLGARVTAVSRLGLDRMKSAGRGAAPFLVRVAAAGSEEEILGRAVIDASGTVGSPNPLGASGLPALGERALASRIFYGMPDALGTHRGRYAGRRVLVVGSGHSAFTALLDLVALAQQAPGTRVHWAIRREDLGSLFGGGEADQLPERGRLGLRMRTALADGTVDLVRGFRLARLQATPDGVVAASAERALPPVDEIVAATGLRPDLALLRELRLAIDPAVECPVDLAPVIDPNVHSCGTVPPHGESVLRQPEPGFYLAGMKSYGRAPNFLVLTGYEQVRSIACALTGDEEGARKVELVLPETGVCSAAPVEEGSGCCAAPEPAPVLVTLGGLRPASRPDSPPTALAPAGRPAAGGCCR